MSSPYPILDNRPIDQLKVTELKEELKRRKLPIKGLKEDLIRRLDEAMRQEQDVAPSEAENGSDSPHGPKEDVAEPANIKNPKDDFDAGNMADKKVDEKIGEVDAADSRIPLGEAEFSIGEPVDGAISTMVEKDKIAQISDVKISAPAKEDQVAEVSVVQTSKLVSASVESSTALSGQDSKNGEMQNVSVESATAANGKHPQNSETQNVGGDVKDQLEKLDSNSSQVEAKFSSSNLENQVSEVSPVLGFQVTCDSVSTDVSIDEKTELKDNVIADDAKLELDVNPEMVQLSWSSIVPDDGKSHPMDVTEPHAKRVSVEEPGNENDNIVKTDGNGDYAEKLQLDRCPGDDFMEEDVLEGKVADSKLDSKKIIEGKKETEVNMSKEAGSVASVDDARSAAHKDTSIEDDGSNVQSMKRKALAADQGTSVGSNDTVKRQRRWNSEDLKIPEEKKGGDLASTTPKDFFQPNFRRSFSRSDSIAKDEAPKERVVPPSLEAPTNSLKIENFLRPFTLKAVQDLLSKTGIVTNFWMDAIKTHCFVSFSSVEAAIETRNSVYNLQWPPNGGKLLVAEFVDPQEVKDKVEAPPQSPLTPASTTPASAAPPSVHPQPSPRQRMQNKQLQPPPSLPPPPPLSNPPALRNLPTAREQYPLPPPPPLPVKADPPILTLDDLFRKTKATPRIYYLPLSDEQVAAKLKAQGKSIEQQ